jgi:hypothetical protein
MAFQIAEEELDIPFMPLLISMKLGTYVTPDESISAI